MTDFGFSAGKIGGGGLHLGIGGGLGDRDHRQDRTFLRARELAGAAFEVGHLLGDIGGGKTGKACILRTAGPFGAMTGAAGPHIRPPTARDDVRHRSMIARMPVRHEEEIAFLRDRKAGGTVRNVRCTAIIGRDFKIRSPRIGPGWK